MKTIRATEVTMEIRLVVERPEGSRPLNTIDLGEWVQDRLSNWITLPFDGDTRVLLESNIITDDDGKEIDYELDPICHTFVK